MKQLMKVTQIMCLMALIFTACENKEEVIPTNQNNTAITSPMEMKTLATIPQAKNGKIDFLQFPDGSIVVMATYSLDDASAEDHARSVDKIQDMVSAGNSYASIYAELVKNEISPQHLKALKTADVQYKNLLQNLKDRSSLNAGIIEKLNVVDNQPSDNARTAVACSKDIFNDNWGANWFVSTHGMLPKPVTLPNGQVFYPPLPSNYRSSIGTNVTQFSEMIWLRSFYRFNAFAADHNIGAFLSLTQFTADRVGNPLIIPLKSYPIDPRYGTSLVFAPVPPYNVVISVSSQCRFHYARLNDI